MNGQVGAEAEEDRIPSDTMLNYMKGMKDVLINNNITKLEGNTKH